MKPHYEEGREGGGVQVLLKQHCTFGKGNKITKHKDKIAVMMRPHQDGGRGRGPSVPYSTNVWPKYPVSL